MLVKTVGREAIIILLVFKVFHHRQKVMKTKFVIEKLSPLKLPATEASVFEQRVAEAAEEISAIGITLPPPHFIRKPTPRSVYERVKCNEFIFVFKYDDYKPDMLHIYSRHMTTPDDVINLYFNYDSVWDEERKRFALFSETHGLYWFWRDEPKKVIMVISCFKRQPERSA